MRTPKADDTRRILEERARALSVAPEPEDAGERIQVLPLHVAGEIFGVEVAHVQEVQPMRGLVSLPSTPDFVAGLMNIRGSIYSIVHLRRFLGLPDAEERTARNVVLVSGAGLTIGILADEVSDVRTVPLDEVAPSPVARSGPREEYVRGVTSDMLVVLNLNAILGDRRIIVSVDDG